MYKLNCSFVNKNCTFYFIKQIKQKYYKFDAFDTNLDKGICSYCMYKLNCSFVNKNCTFYFIKQIKQKYYKFDAFDTNLD